MRFARRPPRIRSLTWFSVMVVVTSISIPPASATTTLRTATLPDRALGEFQNHYLPFSIQNDRGIRFGGIGSDLFHSPAMPDDVFWMVTDRGPNGRPTVSGERRRTFPVPEFDPVILKVRVTPGNKVRIIGRIPILTKAGSERVTGLPNLSTPGPDGDPYDEVPYNFDGSAQLPLNPNGLDTEGIVRGPRHHFWLVDEYSPSLVEVNRKGRVVRRMVPEGLGLVADYPVNETLPSIYRYRKQNRGFEGLALSPDKSTLFVALQSPLLVPDEDAGEASRNTRILRIDLATRKVTGEFVYRFEAVCDFDPAFDCDDDESEMKVSGLVALSSDRLLVLERTDAVARVYEVDLSQATDILGGVYDDPTTVPSLESLDEAGLASAGVVPLPKTLAADLEAAGAPDKVEGIALVDADTLAIANDNDFGLTDNATWDPATGHLTNDTGLPSRILYVSLDYPTPV